MRNKRLGKVAVFFIVVAGLITHLSSQCSEQNSNAATSKSSVVIPRPQAAPSQSQPEPKAEAGPKRKPPLALLRIESTPPGATITIRGTRQPLKTPAEFNLLSGNYEVQLSRDCYASVSTTLHLDAGDNRVLSRQLESLPPAFTVQTVPAGARIFIDGVLRNHLTPATLTGIEAGDRLVTVELAGFSSQNKTVKAKCGETVAVDFATFQRPTAQVSLTSNVRAASVWIDGVDSGHTTPCSVDLALGAHSIRLTLSGYRPEEKSFVLQDAENARLDMKLTPASVEASTNNVHVSPLGESHHYNAPSAVSN